MFECVQICSVSYTLHALQRPAPLRSARRGQSGIECKPLQRVQRPGVCVSCLVLSALVLAWSALPPVLLSRSGCAVVGRGSPAGYIAAAQPRPVIPVTTEKIKKAQKNYPTPIVNLKNFPQKQKDPYKGSAFCAILALQALKGRNLQWLKAK